MPLGLAGVFLALVTWQAGYPNAPMFDEVFHVKAAMELLEGKPSSELSHPPLGKWLIAAGLALWQAPVDVNSGVVTPASAFAWRFMSGLFGAFALVLTYALGRTLFASRTTGAVAAALLALDGVFFVQARAGMLNVFELTFVLAAVLFTWRALDGRRPLALTAVGLALGCAIATRWSAGFAAIVIAALVAVDGVRHAREPGTARWALTAVWALGVLPLLVYVASYVPQYGWPTDPARWQALFDLQGRMFRYHASSLTPHPYESPWWSWPLMGRPVWYFVSELPPGGLKAVWAIGNACLWWATVPALMTATGLAVWHRSRPWAWVAAFGLALWLFWGLQPRHHTYMHYMLPAVPFVCMALGRGLTRLWEGALPLTRREQRWMAVAYGALCVAWFVFYFPLLTWQPFTRGALQARLWLGSQWL